MNFRPIMWIAAGIILLAVCAQGQNPTLVYSTNGLTLFPTNIHGPGKVTIGIDTNSAFWKANAGGTNGISKTFLTNVLVGVYVEQASAAWVDILSKTNYWNAKLDAAATNGFVFASITNGLVGASITNTLASTQWVNSVVGAIDLTSRVAVSNGFGTNTTLLFPRTSGLTNTLGFFLGGPGTIGTNGSVSALTINMTQTNVGPVVLQSNLTVMGFASMTNGSMIISTTPTNITISIGGLPALVFTTNTTSSGYTGQGGYSIAIPGSSTKLIFPTNSGGASIVNEAKGASSAGYLNLNGNIVYVSAIDAGGIFGNTSQAFIRPQVALFNIFAANTVISNFTAYGSAIFAPNATATSPSNLINVATSDARYLGVSGSSNNMAWPSLPYNGSSSTNLVTVTGATSGSVFLVTVYPYDPAAIYKAFCYAANSVTVERASPSTLGPVTNNVMVGSITPLVTSSGLVSALNGVVSNLVNNGTLTQVGVATFNSTITAANANGTAASSIANVGTLDTRHRRRVVINYGGGGALGGNSIVTSSNYFSAPSFSGGYAAYLPPGYTKFIGYTVTFQRTGSGNAILAGTFSASPTLVSAYNISQNANTTRLSGSIVATSGAVIWTNNAATFTFPALGTTNSSLTTNITVNVSLKGNVSADGLESWTNGFGFLRIAFSNYGTLPVSNLWFGGTATFEEED